MGQHLFSQLQHGEFAGIADIDRPGKAITAVHQANHTVDKIIDVTERARLAAIAIDGYVLPFQRLDNEVRHHAAVIGMHARAVSVEDPHDLNVKLMLTIVVEEQGLGTTFAFVVAGADANGIDVTPIVLGLRMNSGVAIDLGCGGLQDTRLYPLGQAQHVDGADHARLGRLDRIKLIVHRRGRAGEVIDLVDFNIERKCNVVAH